MSRLQPANYFYKVSKQLPVCRADLIKVGGESIFDESVVSEGEKLIVSGDYLRGEIKIAAGNSSLFRALYNSNSESDSWFKNPSSYDEFYNILNLKGLDDKFINVVSRYIYEQDEILKLGYLGDRLFKYSAFDPEKEVGLEEDSEGFDIEPITETEDDFTVEKREGFLSRLSGWAKSWFDRAMSYFSERKRNVGSSQKRKIKKIMDQYKKDILRSSAFNRYATITSRIFQDDGIAVWAGDSAMLEDFYQSSDSFSSFRSWAQRASFYISKKKYGLRYSGDQRFEDLIEELKRKGNGFLNEFLANFSRLAERYDLSKSEEDVISVIKIYIDEGLASKEDFLSGLEIDVDDSKKEPDTETKYSVHKNLKKSLTPKVSAALSYLISIISNDKAEMIARGVSELALGPKEVFDDVDVLSDNQKTAYFEVLKKGYENYLLFFALGKKQGPQDKRYAEELNFNFGLPTDGYRKLEALFFFYSKKIDIDLGGGEEFSSDSDEFDSEDSTMPWGDGSSKKTKIPTFFNGKKKRKEPGSEEESSSSTSGEPGSEEESSPSTSEGPTSEEESSSSTSEGPGRGEESSSSTSEGPGSGEESSSSTSGEPGSEEESSSSTSGEPGSEEESSSEEIDFFETYQESIAENHQEFFVKINEDEAERDRFIESYTSLIASANSALSAGDSASNRSAGFLRNEMGFDKGSIDTLMGNGFSKLDRLSILTFIIHPEASLLRTTAEKLEKNANILKSINDKKRVFSRCKEYLKNNTYLFKIDEGDTLEDKYESLSMNIVTITPLLSGNNYDELKEVIKKIGISEIDQDDEDLILSLIDSLDEYNMVSGRPIRPEAQSAMLTGILSLFDSHQLAGLDSSGLTSRLFGSKGLLTGQKKHLDRLLRDSALESRTDEVEKYGKAIKVLGEIEEKYKDIGKQLEVKHMFVTESEDSSYSEEDSEDNSEQQNVEAKRYLLASGVTTPFVKSDKTSTKVAIQRGFDPEFSDQEMSNAEKARQIKTIKEGHTSLSTFSNIINARSYTQYNNSQNKSDVQQEAVDMINLVFEGYIPRFSEDYSEQDVLQEFLQIFEKIKNLNDLGYFADKTKFKTTAGSRSDKIQAILSALSGIIDRTANYRAMSEVDPGNYAQISDLSEAIRNYASRINLGEGADSRSSFDGSNQSTNRKVNKKGSGSESESNTPPIDWNQGSESSSQQSENSPKPKVALTEDYIANKVIGEIDFMSQAFADSNVQPAFLLYILDDKRIQDFTFSSDMNMKFKGPIGSAKDDGVFYFEGRTGEYEDMTVAVKMLSDKDQLLPNINHFVKREDVYQKLSSASIKLPGQRERILSGKSLKDRISDLRTKHVDSLFSERK